jgi:hypothetical protein
MAPVMGRPEEIDRRPHTRRPQIPGTENLPSGRRSSDRFTNIPTHLPGVSLRVEPGGNPNLPESTIEGLLADAIAFKDADAREKAAASDKARFEKRIRQVITVEGVLRGIISEPDDTNLTAIPKQVVTYDPDLLRHSLPAPDFTKSVEEMVIVEFPNPVGVSPDVISYVMAEALREIRSLKRATITASYDVNEKVLAKLVKFGRKLLPGARKVEVSLSLTAVPVVKNPPRDEKTE